MPKRWPPLDEREVVNILKALGITYSHSEGGHDFYKGSYKGQARRVTVDPKNAPFSDDLLKWMSGQAGCTREEFYSATPKTAKKIR
jgi:predicted RNA binding protein YcfA (HicA-like mRNA interferase family)